MDDQTRARIDRAHLGHLAAAVRQLAEHSREHHNCEDSAELLEAIAKRMQHLHDAVMKMDEQRDPRRN